VLAVGLMLLTACDATVPDRRAQVEQLTDQLRVMPGVVAARNSYVNSPAQGLVDFQIDVDLADTVTADQLAAIASHYLDNLRGVDYSGYTSEFDAHQGPNLFSLVSGDRRVDNGDQIIQEARDWVSVRNVFRDAILTFHATITHAGAEVPITDRGYPSAAIIELPDPADYRAVGATAARLGEGYPGLIAGDWTLQASKRHPAVIQTSRRMPTTAELAVWDKLNADQSIAHLVQMTVNGATTGPLWLSEKTITRDVGVAVQLAGLHLPAAAVLPAPVLYTASDKLQAHLDLRGQATAPVAVTIGGCTRRTYKPAPDERALINAYETCKH
jgi:hypothetical protein